MVLDLTITFIKEDGHLFHQKKKIIELLDLINHCLYMGRCKIIDLTWMNQEEIISWDNSIMSARQQ